MWTDRNVLAKVEEEEEEEAEMAKAGDGNSSSHRSGDGELVVKEAKDLTPVLLRVGVAIALSFAGLLFSRLRPRPRPPPLLLPPPSSGSVESEGDGVKAGGGFKEELQILKNEEAMAKIINGNSALTTTTTTMTTTSTLVALPPASKGFEDEEGFLLPEFNEMVRKEFGRDLETIPTAPAPKVKEDAAMEQEISKLRNLVRSLQEREKSLELQLLEYYGMQEQEAVMRELENQLKINNVETKLYLLKIESLRSENQRLQAQVSDYSKSMAELEAMRVKYKLLKKKLRSDAEQAKEKIASLHQMVSALQSKDVNEGKENAEVQEKLKRLEELENESRDLRAANSRLQRENSHLIRRLELAQNASSSFDKSIEAEALEEAERLRQENEKLTKEVEQLQTDRFADVEELVYLKWINACLRYELRNYEAPSGKTVARDLSKTLSPKSEEKAKQLILEYASSGADEKSLGLIEFDSEYSSSQASSGEPDDTSIDISSTSKHSNPRKSKLLSKLRKLVLGKEKESHDTTADRTLTSSANSERRASISSCSFDDFNGRESYDSYSSFMTEELIAANQVDHQSFGRHSLDSQRILRLNTEVGEGNGEHCGHKSVASGEGRLSDFGHSSLLDSGEAAIPEDVEIQKFAEVLKTSRSGSRSSRRSASFSN